VNARYPDNTPQMMNTPALAAAATAAAVAVAIGYHLWRRKSSTECEDRDITVPFSQVKEKLKEVLDREGVAIVTGIAEDAAELQSMERDFHDDLMRLVDADAVRSCGDARVRDAYERFVRDGLLSFPQATAKVLQPIPGFILKACVSAGRFAWRVRRHPRVHAAFAQLFPDESGPLVSSIDVTFFQPPGGGEPVDDQPALSAHCDQNGNDARLAKEPSHRVAADDEGPHVGGLRRACQAPITNAKSDPDAPAPHPPFSPAASSRCPLTFGHRRPLTQISANLPTSSPPHLHRPRGTTTTSSALSAIPRYAPTS
jgi:hypothetical protein